MKWTKEIPDKAGFYWFMNRREGKERTVVELMVDRHVNAGLYVNSIRYSFGIPDESHVDDLWCYIEPPEIE
jgi:hypothetical protein